MSRKAKIGEMIILGVAMLLGLTGCSQKNSTAASGENSGKIGFIASKFSNEFMIAMQQSFLDRAEELGYEVKMEICGEDAETQLNQIEDLILQGVDVLAIRPANIDEGTDAMLEAASEAGIPVFLYDSSTESDEYVSWITTDNYEVGCLAAEAIGDMVRTKTEGKEGKVAVVAGLTTLSTHMDRMEGFRTTLAEEYPEISIVGEVNSGSTEQIVDAVQDWLNLYGDDLDGIYSVTDYLTSAVLETLEYRKQSVWTDSQDGIVVVGTDGNPDILKYLRAGGISGDISQNAEKLGQQTVDTIDAYLHGEDVEKRVNVPTMLLTPSNIDSDEVKEFGLWGDAYEDKYLDEYRGSSWSQ